MATPAKKTTPKKAPAKKTAVAKADDGTVVDWRPAPNEKLADQVPAELAFSTDSGERHDPEKVLISIDGDPAYIYQPSTYLLVLVGGSLSEDTPLPERISTMMNLVNQCLDTASVQKIRAAMFRNDNSFDDDILGKIVAIIIDTWAPYDSSTVNLTAQDKAAQNRAARRQAERAKQ